MLLDYLFTNTGSYDTEPFPYQVISGSGSDWFYDPDSKGRVLVRAPFQFLMIPEKEIVDIGFN